MTEDQKSQKELVDTISKDINAFISKHGLKDVNDLVYRAVTFFLACEKEDSKVKIKFLDDGSVSLNFNTKDVEH